MTTQQFLEFFPKHIIVTPTEYPKADHWNRVGRDLPDQQEEGVAVYFTPNGFQKSRWRREGNVAQFNAVFADFDTPKSYQEEGNRPKEKVEEYTKEKLGEVWNTLEPSFVVTTRNGFQCCWLLSEPLEVTEESTRNYIHVLDSLVELLGGDNGAKGINRVLRVPGYKHYKEIDDTFDIYLSYNEPDNCYTLEEIAEALKIEYPAPIKETKATTAQVNNIEDDVLLGKMFSCKNGDKNKAAWEGDTSHWDDDYSSTDMALVSALAFWTGNDTERMERLWLSSPLGQREKTQQREDYRTRTINNALSTEVYSPPLPKNLKPEYDELDMDSLHYTMVGPKDNKERKYSASLYNAEKIIAHYNICKYDEFKTRYFIKRDDEWEVRADEHDIAIYSQMVSDYPFMASISMNNVRLAINKVAMDNKFDSAKEYVTSIKWDGESRIDHWLHIVFGVEDDQYHTDIGSNWFKGMVSRMVYPGCKFDHALIIKGGQSMGKSSAFLELCANFSDGINTTEFTEAKDKQLVEEIQGKVIAEFSEGAVFKKTDQETVKSIITRQYDRYRVPYEAHARDFPRRCVFAVTTNKDSFLKDDTGNRRWWPVDCGDFQHLPFQQRPKANIKWLKENRDQMFAEAYHRITELKETSYEIDQDELERRQTPFEDEHDDADLYIAAYKKIDERQKMDGVSVRMVYNKAFPPQKSDYGEEPRESHISKSTQMAIASVLQNTKGLNLKKDRRPDTAYYVPRDPLANFTVAVTKHEEPVSDKQKQAMYNQISNDESF